MYEYVDYDGDDEEGDRGSPATNGIVQSHDGVDEQVGAQVL